MRWLFALLFVVSALPVAAAPGACASVWSEDALARLVPSTEGERRFLRLFRESVLPRAERDPEVRELAKKLVAMWTMPVSGLRGEQPWVTEWGVLTFQTSLAEGIVYKSRGEGRLGYNVFKIQADATALGTRPQGLNQTAPKIFAALLLALREDLAASPGLRELRIEAGSVVNRDLVTLLKKIGFAREGKPAAGDDLPWDSSNPDYSRTWFVVLPLDSGK